MRFCLREVSILKAFYYSLANESGSVRKEKLEKFVKFFGSGCAGCVGGFYWTVKEGRKAVRERGLYIVPKGRGVLLYGVLCYGSLAARGE